MWDNMGEPLGHDVHWKKPVKERKILHGSAYMRYWKSSNS